jgi:copper chaperone CopZ
MKIKMLDERMVLRKRKLKIDGMVDSGCEQKIKEVLQELDGIKNINADHETGKLTLEYNIMKTALRDIEPHIESLGYHLPSRFFSKLRRAFIHDADQTARENYSANMTSGCRLNCCTLGQNKYLKRK